MIVRVMRILIIEDSPDIARQLSGHLTQCGFITQLAGDGIEGHHLGEVEDYDAVLLDIGLPGMDGFSILERWRAAGRNMPGIILTARTNKIEIIRGLEAGADDYITKPFDLEEVAARLRTHIRRHKGRVGQPVQYKNVVLDARAGRVSVGGAYAKLTRTEFLMLQYLFMNQGKPVSATELSEHVYDDFDNDSGVIARHIANIRKKIGADIILTESNRGYIVPNDQT